MKTLKFRQKLAKDILAGRRDTTWRLFDDKDISVGDDLTLIVWETGEEFANAKTVSVNKKRLKDTSEAERTSHGFDSQEKMYSAFRKYYGDRVGPDNEVKIITFRLS